MEVLITKFLSLKLCIFNLHFINCYYATLLLPLITKYFFIIFLTTKVYLLFFK